jgi:hypothetical protein
MAQFKIEGFEGFCRYMDSRLYGNDKRTNSAKYPQKRHAGIARLTEGFEFNGFRPTPG